MNQSKRDIRAFTKEELRRIFEENGDQAFRGNQVYEWLWQKGVHSFEAMTNLPKATREMLDKHFVINHIKVDVMQRSDDGTIKNAVRLHDGLLVESVLIPTDTRTTACVSSQVGCSLNCSFCATARLKRMRNLLPDEIFDQVRVIDEQSKAFFGRPLSNIVFMGMGEPLLNYNALLPALRALLDDHGYGLSRRRVTVSTSGVVPLIDRLSEDCPVALAVSLHASNDTLRDQLVPLNRKYPLKELLAACQRYLKVAPRDFITFEYVMLKDINDSVAHARELAALVADVPCKFNLIPFNPFPNSGLSRSSDRTIRQFGDVLLRAGIVTTVRRTRGDEIDAACGQLAGEVVDRTRLRERTVQFHRPAARQGGRPAGNGQPARV